MPKLSINCLFKSSGRMFKVSKQGASEGVDCWYINEVHEVKHDGKVFIEALDGMFTKSKREMNELVKQGKITVI